MKIAAVFVALFLLVVVASGARGRGGPRRMNAAGNDLHDFLRWKEDFGKSYASQDHEATAFRNFQATLQRQKRLRELYPQTGFGPNKFSDLTTEEFRARYLKLRSSGSHANQVSRPRGAKGEAPNDLPDTWDWRKHDAVSYVKDQGQCGSCYIFSAVGNMEGVWALFNNYTNLVVLSEQQALDCDKLDMGCNGGWMSNVYEYVLSAGGVEKEDDYRYYAAEGKCKFDKSKVAVHIDGYDNVTQDETVMQQYLYEHAPLSIGIDATPLQDYTFGIISGGCRSGPEDMNHGVLIVGYGRSKDLFSKHYTYYWIVKNSWGSDWGESGYFLLLRGKNTCGVKNAPTSSWLKK